MNVKSKLLSGIAVASLSSCLSSCVAPGQPVGDAGRTLTGVAPAGTDRVLAIDADGLTFTATPAADGAFALAVASTRPVSVFLSSGAGVRVLKMSSSPGAPQAETLIPAWTGEVNTAQLSTCDCDADGDEDTDAASAELNPLEQVDTDDDGDSDFDDDDDDGDGEGDADDEDRDGSGEDDDGERHDDDDDGSPNLCDDDDDGDGTPDEDDADHRDGDGDGVDDARDHDADGDGEDDDGDADADEGGAGPG